MELGWLLYVVVAAVNVTGGPVSPSPVNWAYAGLARVCSNCTILDESHSVSGREIVDQKIKREKVRDCGENDTSRMSRVIFLQFRPKFDFLLDLTR
jgi:hypothetical protein